MSFSAPGSAFHLPYTGVTPRTPEGKVLVLAFADAYNNLVQSVRNYQPQQVEGGLGNGGKVKVGN